MQVDSEALVQEQSLLLAAARTANLWRSRPLASVHQMVVHAPDGQARTFRFGTESADVPAQVMPLLHIRWLSILGTIKHAHPRMQK